NANKNRREEYLNLLKTGNADGAIIMDVSYDDTTISKYAKSCKIVQCCEYCKDENISRVSIDDFKAAKQAVNYLISLGHKKIALASVENNFISALERKAGYITAMKNAGLIVYEDYIIKADHNYNLGNNLKNITSLLKGENRPTAIFCVSDIMALGIIRGANEIGIRVPKDLSIIGFDNVPYANLFNPRLTTINQPGYDLGKTACNLLISQIKGEMPSNIFLDNKLILRESTRNIL
ncbi:MAG: substrate-binding domain-containing protein, partial [Lachnospirales bacterium]